MKNYTFTEVLLGAVVLAVAAVYGTYLMIKFSPEVSLTSRYSVRFGNAAGLAAGQPVTVNGAKTGKVVSITFDPETYSAVAAVELEKRIKIPLDSTITILNQGLLGGKYIEIEPGRRQEYAPENHIFTNVKDAQSLEEIISRALFIVGDSIGN